MQNDALPEWEALLTSAAHLQRIVPDAVLVGGTAAATYAHHRVSFDHDHTLDDLKVRFDEILASLESVAGWKTARIRRPVLILGSLDGIETGIRQLIRSVPLETQKIVVSGDTITVPTQAEMLRIKAVLILKRNATRDYLDFVALAKCLGDDGVKASLLRFDELYPQPNGESAVMQLAKQLSNPLPFDLDVTNLEEYKNLVAEYQDWENVKAICQHIAIDIIQPIL